MLGHRLNNYEKYPRGRLWVQGWPKLQLHKSAVRGLKEVSRSLNLRPTISHCRLCYGTTPQEVRILDERPEHLSASLRAPLMTRMWYHLYPSGSRLCAVMCLGQITDELLPLHPTNTSTWLWRSLKRWPGSVKHMDRSPPIFPLRVPGSPTAAQRVSMGGCTQDLTITGAFDSS